MAARCEAIPAFKKLQMKFGGYRMRYAWVSQRGYYPDEMEKANQDAHVEVENFMADEGAEDLHLFGVFDGHGKTGDHCAGYVRDQLPGLLKTKCKEHPQDFEKAYKEAFIQVNEGLHKSSIDDSLSGTTAIVVLFEGGTIHVANVGDSRTVLYRRKGAPLMLTDEHKASLESERQRVAAAGGDTVQRTQEVPGVCCFPGKVEKLGPVRVQPGGLAVSRAFGAGHAKLAEHGGKPGVVIHEPSVQRATLSADDDLCLVLASDGVWDNVKRLADLSPDLRTQILQAEQYRAVARHAAEAVVGYALRHAVNEGQQDNTTALVVVLGAQAELALSERRGGGDG